MRLPLTFALLVLTARCPVGCSRGQPEVVTLAPPVEIPVERLSPCTFRLLREIPKLEGFTSVDVDGFPAPPISSWEIDAGVLTILPVDCTPDAGVNVDVLFHERVWLGGKHA